MPYYHDPGTSIEGRKIICEFEKDPNITQNINGLKAKLKGNPATAVIDRVFEWVE